MNAIDLDRLALHIESARREGVRLASLSAQHAHFDIDAGYAVAHRLQQRREAGGARVVGRKIGFTNRELWPVYGVAEPIWGAMYDDTVHLPGSHLGRCRLMGLAEPKIEPEIVLHFASAPQPGDSAADLLRHIDRIAHGFEIVQSPYPGWRFSTADAVAVGSLHGLLLMGPWVSVPSLGPGLEEALSTFSITLSCNGERVDAGVGANVLGSPLHAVAHLIGALASRPAATPVQAGECITTGTLTAAWPVRPGQTWSTHIDGLPLPGMVVEFLA